MIRIGSIDPDDVDVFTIDPAEPFPTPVLVAPATVPDCTACGDTRETWDGRTVEHGTGMPVTRPCTACAPAERRAS